MTDTRRLDGVDVLRGISILSVILLHIWIRMHGTGFSPEKIMPAWLADTVFRNGDNGVTIFFAISGFLITRTSLRRFGSLAKMSPPRFYRIRFARIMPCLLLILGILSILHIAHAQGFVIEPSRTTLPRALFAALTFHLNWLEAVHNYLPANWDVLWSLSVEEMFYLFFPLACVITLRRRHGMVLFIALLSAFIVVGPFQRAVWPANGIWKEKAYLGGMDGIALGCLCALLTERLRNYRYCWPTGIAGTLFIALIFVWPHWPIMRFLGRTGLAGTLLALGACLVMLATTVSNFEGSWPSVPLRWMGRHSYEVYLTHEFVIVWGTQLYIRLHGAPQMLWVSGIALLALIPGAALARYFSEPLNEKLRGKSKLRALSFSASPASS